MGGLSIWHWLVVIVSLVLVVVPVVKILHKVGYSGWWCLLLFIPVCNLIVLWVFAFARWPILQPATQ